MATESAAPDGGWGWLVVACGFTVHLLVSGSHYGLSVLYVSWLQEFGQGKAMTSWIVSIAVALKLFISPFPALLMERYGGGTVQLIGAVLFSLSYVLAALSDSVATLILNIGVIGGIGCGFCYLPCFAVVAPYFNKRRGIAYGLMTSGVGIGAFIFSPLMAFLEREYGWRGALLITAGLMLHLCVCGLLVRCAQNRNTVVFEATKAKPDASESLEERREKEDNSLIGNDQLHNKVFSNGNVVLVCDNDDETRYYSCNDTQKVISMETKDVGVKYCSDRQLTPSLSLSEHHLNHRQSGNGCHPSDSTQDLSSNCKRSGEVQHSLSLASSEHSIPLIETNGNKSGEFSKSKCSVPPEETVLHEIDQRSTGASSSQTNCCSRGSQLVLRYFSLLKDKVFILLVISSYLANMSYFAPVLYMVDRAVEQDIEKTTAALLISINGIANLIGRFSIGALSDQMDCVAIEWMYINSLLLCGLATALSALVKGSFLVHAVYSGCFGLTMGGYTTLAPLVTAKLMGVDRVGQAYSIVLFFMGLGNMTGSPFAGWLFDISGDFFISYVVCGVALMLSACFLVPVICLPREKEDST